MSFDGKKIKAAAVQSGISLTNLAVQLHVSRATLYAYVAGTIQPPEDRVREIARITGCPPDFFITHAPGFTPTPQGDASLRLVDALLSSADARAAAQVFESYYDSVPVDRRGDVLLRLATALVMDGEYQEAVALVHRASTEFASCQDFHSMGKCLQTLGFCYANTGPLAKAQSSFVEAESLFPRESQWKPRVALAVVAERRGSFDEALETIESVQASSNDPVIRLFCLGIRANILGSLGQWRQVLDLELEALALAEKNGISEQIGERLVAIATASIYLRDPKIESRIAHALGYLQASKDRARKALFETVRSAYALYQGRVREAADFALHALADAIKGKYRRAELAANLRLAEIAFAEGKHEEAAVAFYKASAYAEAYEYASEQDYADAFGLLIVAIQGDPMLPRERLEQLKAGSPPGSRPVVEALVSEAEAVSSGQSWDSGKHILKQVSEHGISYLPGLSGVNENESTLTRSV